MTVLLTALAIVLAATIAALVAWEIAHRRSDLVAAWAEPSFPERVTGGLGMRVGGVPHPQLRSDEPHTVVLLHGAAMSSDYFGSTYEGLANEHRVVAVDLLGFGRSLDEYRVDYSIDAQVDAIDGALASVGAAHDRVCLAATSMGASVAARWAARHPERTTRVVLWGPPIPSAVMSDQELVESSGPLTRFVLDDRRGSRWLREWSRDHPTLAGWVIAALFPRLPVPLARGVAQHDWAAWRAVYAELVLEARWPDLLADVDAPVTVFEPTDPAVGEPRGGGSAGARPAGTHEVVTVVGGGEHLAITHPHLLFELLGV